MQLRVRIEAIIATKNMRQSSKALKQESLSLSSKKRSPITERHLTRKKKYAKKGLLLSLSPSVNCSSIVCHPLSSFFLSLVVIRSLFAPFVVVVVLVLVFALLPTFLGSTRPLFCSYLFSSQGHLHCTLLTLSLSHSRFLTLSLSTSLSYSNTATSSTTHQPGSVCVIVPSTPLPLSLFALRHSRPHRSSPPPPPPSSSLLFAVSPPTKFLAVRRQTFSLLFLYSPSSLACLLSSPLT